MTVTKLVLIAIPILAIAEAGGLWLLQQHTAGTKEGPGAARQTTVVPERGTAKEVNFTALSEAAVVPLRSAVLSVRPDDSLEVQAFGDILTCRLLKGNINVVTLDQLARLRGLAQSRTVVTESTETRVPGSSAARTEVRSPRLDMFELARVAGADCLIRVNVALQSSQQHVYGGDQTHVSEVRVLTRISLITATVVDLTGRIGTAGSISYSEPVSVETAAADLAEALVLRSQAQ
jgi:hypothetical protein